MATTPMTAEKIGFWRRFVAYLIDAVLIWIVGGLVLGVVAGGDPIRANSILVVVGFAYFMYFWSSYGRGQTLGMRALGIKVVKTDGSQLDLVGALIRYVGLFISFLVFAIGVIWIAFDKEKQGWHDKIANTYVVKA